MAKIIKCLIIWLSLVLVAHSRPETIASSAIPTIISATSDDDYYGSAKLTESASRGQEQPLLQPTCGYESCPKPVPGKLNVHIVPHTHDDVGWLKTVDQYYYGSQTRIQKAGVQYILDSVVQELLKDPKKKFIYVESAFFFQWWREQSEDLQEKVKQLVNEGRLEFIGGAWSMNDEATSHYQSIIDQFSWGLRKLNDTFGTCGRPKIGWQIDPFGHSREMASIFAHMGYDGLFFGRLDYQDRRERLNSLSAEMIWQSSASQLATSDLFTGVLYNQYQAPSGFCFDILCADEPIIDGKHSPDNNVDRRVADFLRFVNTQRRHYKTNNIIITMGGDFTFMDANVYYKNLDKLIKYTNEKQANGSDVNMFYSTPSCYLKALHDANQTWPTKSDDFFPYSSDPHAFWTGYYTSRPNLKRFERIGNHFLQISKQLSVLSPHNERWYESHLTFMRETMGIMQHHDAVTGTEKQKVASDYAKRLNVAIKACASNAKAILNTMVTGQVDPQSLFDDKEPLHKFQFENCLDLNISLCDVSEQSEQFTVTIYNPLPHSTFQYVRVPVSPGNYLVMDYRNISTEFQLVPIPSPVKQLNYRRSNSSVELVFLAGEVPPIGYKSYFISRLPDIQPDNPSSGHLPSNDLISKQNGPVTIGNKYINLTFNENGLLSSVSSNGITRNITQNFLYYEGAVGDNKAFRNRSSGAYIFRPNNTVRLVAPRASIQVIEGPAVVEVHQVFNEWVSQVIRVYENDYHAEFEWMVGPIPVDDVIGKEVITRFESDIQSKGVFYTDSNGREMIKRRRNKRDTWTPHLSEKIAGNYYPLTSKIALEDSEARLAILVDRAQGGSSLKDGSIEIMVHRRLLHDDAFGVGEALNETAFGNGMIARGQHYLILGPPSGGSPSTKAKERFLQKQKHLSNWLFFSDTFNISYNQWMIDYSNIKVGLANSLPQHINILSLEPWHTNQVLIRFEHILEKDDDEILSQPCIFNLKDTIRSLKMESIRETTLDGNLWLDELHRLNFTAANPAELSHDVRSINVDDWESEPLLSARRPLIESNYLTEKLEFESDRLDRDLPSDHDGVKRWISPLTASAAEALPPPDDDPFQISMSPMQIRTFIITLEQQI